MVNRHIFNIAKNKTMPKANFENLEIFQLSEDLANQVDPLTTIN
jgi:hypothetical protein